VILAVAGATDPEAPFRAGGARDGAPRVTRYPSKGAAPWQSRVLTVYHLI